MQRVWKRRMVDLGGVGAEARFIWIDLAGQRERHHRAAVKAAGEGDHRRAAGGDARDLDGGLDRLGAGRHQDGLVRSLARRERIQFFAERDIGLVGRDLETGVGDLVELRAHGLEHVAIAMAGVEHGDSAREIDVAAPVAVPEERVFGALDEDRMHHRHAARDGGLAPFDQ